MGRTGRSAQKVVDPLRELEKLVRMEKGLPTVDYEVLLRDEFRGLRVGQLAERFPSLSVVLPVERNRWAGSLVLRLRGKTVLLIARGATGAASLVSRRDFFLMTAKALSSHGFKLSRMDEGRLVLIRKVTGNERTGRLLSALKGTIDGLFVKAERLERVREKKKVAELVAAMRTLDGGRLGASPTPSLVIRMLLSSVYPELAAFLLLVVEPVYEKAVCDAVLREMGFDEKRTSMVLHDAWTFGLVGASGDSVLERRPWRSWQTSECSRRTEGSGPSGRRSRCASSTI